MIEVFARDGRPLRIGHRGAAALAPENTLRGFERAIAEDVDIVEFDVLALADGTLVLAHSDDLAELSHGAVRGRLRAETLADLRRFAPELPTLEEALAFLGEHAPHVGLHADLKWYGYERAVVEALRRAGRAVHRADDVIGATLADPPVADALRVPVGAPLLEMTRTMYDDDGEGIAYQWTVASPDVMKLRIALTGEDEPS